MDERCSDLSFTTESLDCVGHRILIKFEKLDGDDSMKRLVSCPPDRTHSSLADEALEIVTSHENPTHGSSVSSAKGGRYTTGSTK